MNPNIKFLFWFTISQFWNLVTDVTIWHMNLSAKVASATMEPYRKAIAKTKHYYALAKILNWHV